MKKIAILTTTRAEYGILRTLACAVREAEDLKLQLIVSGSHLLEAQGRTLAEIEADGLPVAAQVPIFAEQDATPQGNAQAFGRMAERLAPVLDQLKPDKLVVLGDRFETLAAVSVAVMLHIPVVHLHGGEETAGALDNRFRHAISQLADMHLTATKKAREKLIQMGLSEDRVHHVGALGVWNALSQPLKSLDELQKIITIPLKNPLFVITFHPETATDASPTQQVRELIAALEAFPDSTQIITFANMDAGGGRINQLWQTYADKYSDRVWLTPSLGQQNYHSLLQYADVVIGNSSSGILEAPSFGVPTVNIGQRQAGRERAESVFDAPAEKRAIQKSIEDAIQYQGGFNNPYTKADVLKNILDKLRDE